MLIIPLLLIGTFICLFPLLLYCLHLAGVNNRPRPTLVSGTWDFAWVLVATCGFWILGGPAVLVGLNDLWRRVLWRGSFATIRDYLHLTNWPWALLWAAYFVIFVASTSWLLWRRRSVAVVYHIDPNGAYKAIEAALDRLGSDWSRLGNAYVIAAPSGEATVRESSRAVLEIAMAPSLRNMTIRWVADGGRLREQFEEAFEQVLDGHQSGDNPLVGWLLTVATVLFVLMLFCVALFVVFAWNVRG